MERYKATQEQLTLKDVLIDSHNLEEEVVERQSNLWVMSLTQRLTPKQKDIIMKRFGFETGEPMTLEEVGSIYGITKERVRQIERQSILKLRSFISLAELKSKDAQLRYEKGLKNKQQSISNSVLTPQHRQLTINSAKETLDNPIIKERILQVSEALPEPIQPNINIPKKNFGSLRTFEAYTEKPFLKEKNDFPYIAEEVKVFDYKNPDF